MKKFFYAPASAIWNYILETFHRILEAVRAMNFVFFQVIRLKNDDFDFW